MTTGNSPSAAAERIVAARRQIAPGLPGAISDNSSQPLRYSRRMYWSASGAFVAAILAASHVSFLPTRYATFPRWFASVSQPEYVKFADAGLPALQHSTHSAQWPFTRGSDGAGPLYPAKSF